MKLQRQTIFGRPNGNCFATCVASLFDLDLDVVPNFCAIPGENCEWWDAFRAWCRSRGLEPIQLPIEAPGQGGVPAASWASWLAPGQVVIASGRAARGLDHCTLYRDGALFWDPHPDETGIERVENVIVFMCIAPAVSS